jgi:hypothetical protein
MEAYALRPDGSTVRVDLLDLNYDGCGVATSVKFETGERLKISVTGLGLIEANVRWCEGGKAGLRFTSAELEAAEEPTPRASERAEVAAEVRLRRLGQNNYSVRIFDISPEGCRVETVERPRPGEQLMIKFNGIEALESQVMWVDEFIAGVKFNRPLHPAVFDLLLSRLSTAG